MKRFWNFIRNEAGERELRLDGPIDEDLFWGDEITPQMFREELEAEAGDLTVWIHSPGGNVFAAAEIYTMLCEHKGKITVKIDAIAASAASVVAMAGDRVLMSPVAMLMVHDPMTLAVGNARDMEKAISTLNEVKESIINAYRKKCGLSRGKISQLMENETWMNAEKAVELGFADDVMYADKSENEDKSDKPAEPVKPAAEPEKMSDPSGNSTISAKAAKSAGSAWNPFSTRMMGQAILNRLMTREAAPSAEPTAEPTSASASTAEPSPVTEPIAVSEPSPVVVEPTTEPTPKELDQPETLVIGMDGKTKDGSMPYDLLMNQLNLLK